MKITIEGMMCQHCVQHVTNALNELDGITDVTVDLEEGTATVQGKASIEAIRTVIDEAGYNVISVEP